MPFPKKSSLALATAAVVAAGTWHEFLRSASRGPPPPLSPTAATPTPAAATDHPVVGEKRAASGGEDSRRRILAAPDAAAAAALTLPGETRLAATAEILTALADRPDEAVRIAGRFCREDPAFVREHGNTLIAVLTAAREYERAVSFAAAGGPERGEWLARAFRGWVDHAPAAAATAALAFEGDDATPTTFNAWAARDPMAVARFAAESPAPAAPAAARDALEPLLEPPRE